MACERYIGLMSGTSADAMDAALVRFDDDQLTVEAFVSCPYTAEFTATLRTMAVTPAVLASDVLTLERQIAEHAAAAALQLLEQAGVPASAIRAIGSHGHTLRHQPDAPVATWQVGDPSRIAELTGICCVADFRRRDIAAGGQGAPLVPAFHARYLGSVPHPRMVLNIGGIANLSILRGDATTGFDCGPGNALMDEWCQRYLQQACDFDGALARQGQVQNELLVSWLQHDYFQRQPPKSTGRELFRLDHLAGLESLCAADVLATLTELTARSVAEAIRHWGHTSGEVLVCGGGVRNRWLLERLQQWLPNHQVVVSDHTGISSESMEAVAFAWLARQTLSGLPGNQPSVTGARGMRILGGIYPA